jgi:catechol 2,3-dioxygenase-like lactoylglutathione lyase family enzyme
LPETGECSIFAPQLPSLKSFIMRRIISGIQQVGIGVSNADEAFRWYRKIFGTDIVVFKDAATASLMKPYTGQQAHDRYAILALNMQSGGGFEIWQYTSRTPVASATPIQAGDLGIYAVKIKSRNVAKTYELYKQQGVELLTTPTKAPTGIEHFFMKDPYGNVFEVTADNYWFTSTDRLTGAVCGVTIGVSSIPASLPFYKNVLGYDIVEYSGQGHFEDLKGVPGGQHHFKRVLLKHSRKQEGPFSKLLGPTSIELLEVTDRTPVRIYDNRYWGDLGFIHVCFDINGFKAHEEICNANGAPLTVDSSNSFDMGEAAGHFAYNEDPDGTLIEYVETHRVPILKKIGWYLDLRKRNPEKPLPNWMVKSLSFSRVKD